MITCQEIFNAAWQAFVIEGKPFSHNGEGHCLYRGPNGMKCAIGLCIPDNLYTPAMEEKNARDLEDQNLVEFDDVSTAAGLQSELHDDFIDASLTPDELANHYRLVAAKYNLEVPTSCS